MLDYQRQLEQYRTSQGRKAGLGELPVVSFELKGSLARPQDTQRTQLREAVDQLEKIMGENGDLEMQVRHLTASLATAVQGIEDANQRISSLQRALRETDHARTTLAQEHQRLESKYESLVTEHSLSQASDDKIFSSVNDAVARWRQMLGEKDAELSAAQQIIASLKHDLESTSVEREAELHHLLDQRENELEVLHAQLKQATEVIERFSEEVEVTVKAAPAILDLNSMSVAQLQRRLQDQELELVRAKDQLEDKDAMLVDALQRMVAYEQGTFGLHEAVQEIKDHKAQLVVRDKEVAETVAKLNALNHDLCTLADENEDLRHRCVKNMPPCYISTIFPNH